MLLNWRSAPVVYDAAASALRQADVDVELIIVDNGSDDESLPELKRRFANARFIELGQNTGFSVGMTSGIEAATTEYVLLQNADLILDEYYCSRSVELMLADPSVGAVGGLVQQLQGDQRTTSLDACGYLLHPSFRVELVPQTTPGNVMGVSGSCPMIRKQALDDVREIAGYTLDPWYFAYFEDIDLMLRMNLAGWIVRYHPDLRAWHVRSYSTGASRRFFARSLFAVRHQLKNRLATIVKNCPTRLMPRLAARLILTELLLPFYLAMRRPAAVPALFQAWRIVWRERKRLLDDRRRIQQAAITRGTLKDFEALIAP